MKTHQCVDQNNELKGYMIFCPACGNGHLFDKRWTFNGDMDKPTFTPSMLIKTPHICHSYVTDGKIQFLNDCTHHLKGQTVDLEEF